MGSRKNSGRPVGEREREMMELMRLLGITEKDAKTQDFGTLMDRAMNNVTRLFNGSTPYFHTQVGSGDIDIDKYLKKIAAREQDRAKNLRDKAKQTPVILLDKDERGAWYITATDTWGATPQGQRFWTTLVCECGTNYFLETATSEGEPTVDVVEEAILKSMAHPGMGEPRRPQQIVIANRLASIYSELVRRLSDFDIEMELEAREEAEASCREAGTDPDGRNHANFPLPSPDTPDTPASEAHKLKEKGNEFFQARQYKEAIVKYTEAIEVAPDDHIMYSNRSIANLNAGDPEAALADAEKCLTLDPKFMKGYARKGQALEALERWDDALALYAPLRVKYPQDLFYQKAEERVRSKVFDSVQ